MDRELEKLTRLLQLYGEEDFKNAITQALSRRTFGARYVGALLDQARFARGLQEPPEPILPHRQHHRRFFALKVDAVVLAMREGHLLAAYFEARQRRPVFVRSREDDGGMAIDRNVLRPVLRVAGQREHALGEDLRWLPKLASLFIQRQRKLPRPGALALGVVLFLFPWKGGAQLLDFLAVQNPAGPGAERRWNLLGKRRSRNGLGGEENWGSQRRRRGAKAQSPRSGRRKYEHQPLGDPIVALRGLPSSMPNYSGTQIAEIR